MGEVYVKCIECGDQQDEVKHELSWDSYYIYIEPCNHCLAALEADIRAELEK